MSQYHVTNGLKLYQWHDTLIVATTKRDVQSHLIEDQGLTLAEFRRFPVTLIDKGTVDMREDDSKGNFATVKRTPREVIDTCGRGIIPEGE